MCMYVAHMNIFMTDKHSKKTVTHKQNNIMDLYRKVVQLLDS